MPLFFKFKRPIEATVDIVCLTGVTGYLTYIWSQVDAIAAWGIVPYLGWLGFATYLSVCFDHSNSYMYNCSELTNFQGRRRLSEQLELCGQRKGYEIA